MRAVALVALFCCVCLSWTAARPAGAAQGPASAESRLALVAGNGAYTGAPLANPRNDARDVADILRRLGFEVTLELDADEPKLYRTIRAFGDELRRRQGVGLFYYAGHAVQVSGRNYLIPLGADIRSEEEVRYQAVDVGLVLAKMEAAGNRLNIVILDACRDNPYATDFRSLEQGLARMEAPSGTLVAYATAPGRTAADGRGRNSPYTKHLVEVLKRPGLTVEEVFKRVRKEVMGETDGRQVPWESSSLVGDFYFNASRAAQPLGSGPSAAQETLFWETVKDSTNPSDFREYLKQFPGGTFVGLARNRLSELEGDAASAAIERSETERLTSLAPAPESHKGQAGPSRESGGLFKIAVFPFSGEGDRTFILFPRTDLMNFVQGFLEKSRDTLSLVEVDAKRFAGNVWADSGRRLDVGFVAESGAGIGVDGVLTYWYRTVGTPGQARLTAYLVDVSRRQAYRAEGPWLAKEALTEEVVSEFVRTRQR